MLLIYMQDFKKLYSYVVMISLAGFQTLLLILFIQMLLELLVPPPKTQLSFQLTAEKVNTNFNGHELLRRLKYKMAININLTGIKELDDKLMEKIQLETRKLNATDDTTHFIKIHFTSNNTYGQFVQLVNMMHLEMQKRYAYWEDDFYILW